MKKINVSIDVDGTLTKEVIGQDILELSALEVERAMLNCTPKDGIDILFDDILSKNDCNTFIITGRQEKYRRATSKWLNTYGIPYDELIMFPNDFYTINGYTSPKYIDLKVDAHIRKNIHFSLDDHERMVSELNRHGIVACRVTNNFRDAFNEIFKVNYQDQTTILVSQNAI